MVAANQATKGVRVSTVKLYLVGPEDSQKVWNKETYIHYIDRIDVLLILMFAGSTYIEASVLL